MFKDNSGGTNTNKRTAEHYDAGGQSQSAQLTVITPTIIGSAPDWQAGTGPHGSGSYYYDGEDMCHRSSNNVSNGDGNHIQNRDTTTSLWFRTDGIGQVSSEQMLVFWEGDGVYPLADYYKISLGEDGTGKLLFEFNEDNGGTKTSTCRSVNEYDDGDWHHVVAVKTNSNDRCDLYITDLAGADEETPVTHSPNHSNSIVDADGKWYVGTREESGNFFKGWIDDVMHWNDDALTASEADELSHTNYGTGAHQLDVNLDLTDQNGVFVSNLYNGPATGIAFQDPKNQGNTIDSAYTMFNVTMTLPQTVVLPLQRLNFSMAFVPSTSTWEALELDMKIDDTGFTAPHPSYIQIPMPDNPFTSYIVYDNDNQMKLIVNNIGSDGVYLVYPGTRLVFDGTLGSYSSLIQYVNGTDPSYVVDITKDSIYIPAGEMAEMHFFIGPTDHPCNDVGSSCTDANIIPAGDYRGAVWINGYSDQGETFGRSVILGNVLVIE